MKMLFPLVCAFGIFDKCFICVVLCALTFVPSIMFHFYMSVLVPVPYCFDYYSSVIYFRIWIANPSSIILFVFLFLWKMRWTFWLGLHWVCELLDLLAFCSGYPVPQNLKSKSYCLIPSADGTLLAKHQEITKVTLPSLTKMKMTNGEKVNLQQALWWAGARNGVSEPSESHYWSCWAPAWCMHYYHVCPGMQSRDSNRC